MVQVKTLDFSNFETTNASLCTEIKLLTKRQALGVKRDPMQSKVRVMQ